MNVVFNNKYMRIAAMAGVMTLMAGSMVYSESNDMVESAPQLPDLYNIWNYNDPAGTRAKFEEILPKAEQSGDTSYYLQLLTQIARTYGLEAEFDSSHALLDTVEQRMSERYPVVQVRYLLERGRAFNSDKQKDKALPLFVEAYETALDADEDFYAVDAAHMVAIAAPNFQEKEKWALTGIKLAEESSNPRTRKWLGSLYNNMGWDYFDQKQYENALDLFEKALKYREEQGDQQTIEIARWCIAKVYRFLGRIDEALEIQTSLLTPGDSSQRDLGYTYEELGELYLIKDDTAQSQKYFAMAYEDLSKDTWLSRNEIDRLNRMKKLGGLEDK